MEVDGSGPVILAILAIFVVFIWVLLHEENKRKQKNEEKQAQLKLETTNKITEFSKNLKLKYEKLQEALKPGINITPTQFGKKKLYTTGLVGWNRIIRNKDKSESVLLSVLNDGILIDTSGKKDIKIKYNDIVYHKLHYQDFFGFKFAISLEIKTDNGFEYCFTMQSIPIVSELFPGIKLFEVPKALYLDVQNTLEYIDKLINEIPSTLSP